MAENIVRFLPPELVRLGVRLVVGNSDMLRKFAENYMNAQINNTDAPNAIILLGKLRQRDLRNLFEDAIYYVPNLAILLGGGGKIGRVKEEYDDTVRAGIPVIPIYSTGGVAKQVEPTADKVKTLYKTFSQKGANVDAGDLVQAIVKAVRIYVND